MVGWCAFVIIIGTFLMIAGTYGSIVEIANGYSADGDHQPGLVQTIPALYNSIIQMKMHASW
jgi:hypothetical protein